MTLGDKYGLVSFSRPRGSALGGLEVPSSPDNSYIASCRFPATQHRKIKNHVGQRRTSPITRRSRERTVPVECQDEQKLPRAIRWHKAYLECFDHGTTYQLALLGGFMIVGTGALAVGLRPFQQCYLGFCHGVSNPCSRDRMP